MSLVKHSEAQFASGESGKAFLLFVRVQALTESS